MIYTELMIHNILGIIEEIFPHLSLSISISLKFVGQKSSLPNIVVQKRGISSYDQNQKSA